MLVRSSRREVAGVRRSPRPRRKQAFDGQTLIISDASVVKECPSNNIRLFKINYACPERIATGSVYYVKIYDMNASGEYELVRNLVPCKPDNAPAGLLDLIEMKFYKNNGTWISLAQ